MPLLFSSLLHGGLLSNDHVWHNENITIRGRSIDLRVQSALLFTRYWTTANTGQHDNTLRQLYTVRRNGWSYGIEDDLLTVIDEILRVFEPMWILTSQPTSRTSQIIIEIRVVNECSIIFLVFLEQRLRAADLQTCAEEHKTDDNYGKYTRWIERKSLFSLCSVVHERKSLSNMPLSSQTDRDLQSRINSVQSSYSHFRKACADKTMMDCVNRFDWTIR